MLQKGPRSWKVPTLWEGEGLATAVLSQALVPTCGPEGEVDVMAGSSPSAFGTCVGVTASEGTVESRPKVTAAPGSRGTWNQAAWNTSTPKHALCSQTQGSCGVLWTQGLPSLFL